MKFKTLLSKAFSPIVTFLQAAIQRLSAQDGKPGLSLEDISLATEKAVKLAGEQTSKSFKAQSLAVFIRQEFGSKLPVPGTGWNWIPEAIAWAVVLIAKRLKLIS